VFDRQLFQLRSGLDSSNSLARHNPSETKPLSTPRHPNIPLITNSPLPYSYLFTTTMSEIRKHACTICARRKVKCDKTDPCSNCQKAGTQCSYEAPAPPKPRKRAADEDLLARLAVYEELMKKNGVDFTQHVNVWRSSGLENKVEDGDEIAPTEL
jgi:hypothetical protein